jgi:hypothetical protein
MATSLRLYPQQVADLQTITSIDRDLLQRVLNHLCGLTSELLRPKQLRSEISSVLSDNEENVEAVTRQLLSFHSLIGQIRLAPSEIISAVTNSLATDEKWSDESLAAWREREGIIRDLLSLDSVRIVAKALDLSYEYANLLRTGRIITDVRPVFTLDAKAIDGAVISHKLFVRYDNVEGLKTVTMTLDEADVKSLQKECARALDKANTVAAHLSKGIPMRTIIPGRENNE